MLPLGSNRHAALPFGGPSLKIQQGQCVSEFLIGENKHENLKVWRDPSLKIFGRTGAHFDTGESEPGTHTHQKLVESARRTSVRLSGQD